jgi:hypothetical protein
MFSKYFNHIIDTTFKMDNNGNTVFFPFGNCGKGRIITNELLERKVRDFLDTYFKVCLLIIFLISVLRPGFWSLLLLPIFQGWLYLAMKSLLNGCPYSEEKLEKLSFREYLTKSATIFNKFTLWLLLLGSSLFVVAGITLLIVANSPSSAALILDKSPGNLLAIIGGIVFFGACSFVYAYMLILKKT